MQSTDSILMIEPIAFGFNAQTAINNYFQVNDGTNDTQVKALNEFNIFVEKLRNKGINVLTVRDTLEPHTPDSIFPNNWVSFHNDGTVILYPMFAKNRRLERRTDIFDRLMDDGFKIATIKDYTFYEGENKFLEGTGSMILDRENKIAYGAISMRLDVTIFKKWCSEFDYRPVSFNSFQSVGVSGERRAIYHTNVMMCVASDFVVICSDSIDDKAERAYVEKMIMESNKEIIKISEQQMHNFAGNMLEVRNCNGKKFMAMSECAFKHFTSGQIQAIERHAEIIYSDLSTIERLGGGSARCRFEYVFCLIINFIMEMVKINYF